jgi:hypothetical protein
VWAAGHHWPTSSTSAVHAACRSASTHSEFPR